MAAHLTFMIKTEKSMLKYEIVSILRNKAAYIFLLVVLLFGTAKIDYIQSGHELYKAGTAI